MKIEGANNKNSESKIWIKTFATIILFLLVYSTLFSQISINQHKRPVIIQGYFPSVESSDNMNISATVLKSGFSATSFRNEQGISGHFFQLSMDSISVPSYIQIRVDSVKKAKLLTPLLLIEPEDTIVIYRRGKEYEIAGAKPQLALLVQVMKTAEGLISKRWGASNKMKPTVQNFLYRDSISLVQLDLLDSIKHKISNSAYCISKIDILAGNQNDKMIRKFNLLNKENYLKFPSHSIYGSDPQFPDYSSIEKSLLLYEDVIAQQLQDLSSDCNVLLPFSIAYINYVDAKYRMDSCLVLGRPFDFGRYYSYVKRNFTGYLGERLIMEAINNNLKKTIDLQYFISDALSYIKNSEYREILLCQKGKANGNPAYKFELPDINGNVVKLDSLKGKVVVLDFWFTGCINCINLHPKFNRVIDHFKNNPNVIFVSISIDSEQKLWLKSIKEGNNGGFYTSIDKKNVINLYTGGLGKDHPLIKYHRVLGYPTLILINQEGNIEQAPTDPRGDNGKAMIMQIKGLLER